MKPTSKKGEPVRIIPPTTTMKSEKQLQEEREESIGYDNRATAPFNDPDWVHPEDCGYTVTGNPHNCFCSRHSLHNASGEGPPP